ncbi:MAG: DUF3108 domain-containing protein [Phycisphaerae bacterium]|nr:DUF3108 domain-containing protein [Gemmatimonadaceae bacterium]
MLTSGPLIRSALLLALTQASAVIGHSAAAQSSVQTGTPSRSLAGSPAGAQAATDSGGASRQMAPVPFGVGERMDYDVRYLGGKKGVGSMEVKEITDVRGRRAWHTVFKVEGQVMFLINVNIRLESWFDVATMNSLRFHQDQRYTGTKRVQNIEIFPERGMYKEDKLEERVTVKDPLDDGSFLYFVRSLPLEVGKEYLFRQYYKPEKNPVKITVVRRESVKTPAGVFNTLVLRPEIKSGGLFAEGKAEVWITDDAARMVVKLESELPVGTISLWLTKYELGVPFKP